MKMEVFLDTSEGHQILHHFCDSEGQKTVLFVQKFTVTAPYPRLRVTPADKTLFWDSQAPSDHPKQMKKFLPKERKLFLCK